MAASVIVDASFLVTLLDRRETNHRWAASQALQHPPPWNTCEAVISETLFLLGPAGVSAVTALLRRGPIIASFHFSDSAEEVLALMQKYSDVPMSFADACLVRMTEMLADPVLITLDADFRIYRRHGRRTIPCVTPN